jgi:hypothetical protein
MQVVMWLTAASAAIWFAFQRGPGADKWGFYLIIAAATGRAVTYGWGWLESVGSWGGPGDPEGWVGAIGFALITWLGIIAIGWTEPVTVSAIEEPWSSS